MKAILTYHSIDDTGSVISIAPDVFRGHIAWLTSERVRVLSVTELLAAPDGDDAVALTFDDGFENFAKEAWPLLRDAGLPATVFVISEHVGGSNSWEAHGLRVARSPLLDWDTLRRLVAEGVTVGGHSRNHADLRTLSQQELADDLHASTERIQAETGSRPEGFAYPFGALDDRVVSAVRDMFAWACTTELRAVRTADDPHRLPRLDTYYYQRPGALHAWGTARFRLRLGLRAAVRRARRRLVGITA